MSRPAAFQRSMARLALLAMLALTLLPGIGRLAQSATIAGSDAIASEYVPGQLFGAICTTQGLAYDPAVAAIEAIGFSTHIDDDRSPAPPHAGNDCDYCTIASASNVSAFTALAAPALVRDIALPPRRDHVAIWRYPLGLGSRGPPHTA
jgi:hypothetical protein